ncbi:ABC transporter permease [Nocardioides caldifontis]|uniref:ABC transporter permease n=1 Tax=Nocardioides caldifontis TaxID=2588938 RepID=UPI001EF11D61|nr:ABC transporter permease [Nocardioides caldifontis]
MSALSHVPGPTGGTPDVQATDPGTERRGITGYLLMLPGTVWLLLFFLVPLVTLVSSSLYDPSGSLATGYSMTGHVQNYADALSEYGSTFVRSFLYALTATIACLLLGFPLAYAIALKAGRWRNLMLVAVIAPFFTSFLLRTLSWKLLLGDDSWVVNALQALPLVPDDLRLLATPAAVITGLTYNFLPFMVLPLYASLERLDVRLVEAAADLYASPFTAFRLVTVPLAMPGIVAGTLLTFIPAAGDFINSELLGNPRTRMIGNDINDLFQASVLPTASALSVMLMVAIVALVAVYVRRSGTDELV